MKHIKRFSALVLALVMVASLAVVPAHAEQYVSRSNFWQWIAGETGGIYQKIVGNITGDAVCPDSQDGKHHASSYVYDAENGHYSCICDYCGETFTATATNMQDAYTDYVETLPVNGIDSDGGFIWYPTCDDLNFDGGFYLYATYSSNTSSDIGAYSLPSTVHPSNASYSIDYSAHGRQFIAYWYPYGSSTRIGNGPSVYGCLGGRLTVPVSGTYNIDVNSQAYSVTFTGSNPDYSGVPFVGLYPDTTSTKQYDGYYSSGSSIGFSCYNNQVKYYTSGYMYDATFTAFLPSYHVQIAGEYLPDSSVYAVDTRPTSFTGKYLVQNGDAYEDSSTTIIDESTSSVYNPVTGDTTTYDSWIYDYSTRTYTMTDNTNNSTTTVTYGDENITINEGGNTYNIYYGTVVNNGDSGGGGSGGGDDSGDGGILSRLGELLGTLVNGLLGGITSFVSAIFDGLIALANVISEKFGQVVEAVLGWFAEIPALFSGFTEFLSAVFVYIPADLMLLLSFGLAAVVFIAIIKALRR